MKQSLQLKMGQHLTMTPQLQQAIRLLQLSTLDLQQEIQEIVDTNPMLEVSEENDTNNDSSSEANDSAPELQTSANNSDATQNHSDTDTVGDDYIAANAAETAIDKDDTSRSDD
ncbi:MAG: RNA polymerase factor sigma-54, partial [Pseudomonadales bacterium]